MQDGSGAGLRFHQLALHGGKQLADLLDGVLVAECRKQVQIGFGFVIAQLVRQKGDDRIVPHGLFLREPGVLHRLLELLHQIHREPQKQQPRPAPEPFGMADVPVDDTTGTGWIQILLLLNLLRNLPFQHEHHLKIIVLVGRAAVEGRKFLRCGGHVVVMPGGGGHFHRVHFLFPGAGAVLQRDLQRR